MLHNLFFMARPDINTMDQCTNKVSDCPDSSHFNQMFVYGMSKHVFVNKVPLKTVFDTNNLYGPSAFFSKILSEVM